MTIATSRMMTRKFSNCSIRRFHHGVSGAFLVCFGPYCSSRRFASALSRPRAASERRFATATSAGSECGTALLLRVLNERALVCIFIGPLHLNFPVRHRSAWLPEGPGLGWSSWLLAFHRHLA